MKKNFGIICVLCLIIASFNTIPIKATSGKLKSASIVSCDGVNYGNHGDGHWHRATKHDAGWYPDGGSLGYDNPCSSGSGYASEPEQRGPSASEIEAQRVEDARVAAEEARLEEERKVQEALELAETQRLEALALEEARLEALKLSDVSLESVVLNNANFDESPSQVKVLKQGEYKNLAVKTTNKDASTEVSLKNASIPFTTNTLIVSVKSENAEATKEYQYSFMELGSNDELLTQNIQVVIGEGESVEYQNATLDFGKMSESKLSDLKIKEIEINNETIKLDDAASLKKIENNEEGLYTMNFKINDQDYSINVKVDTSESMIVPIFVTLLLVGTGAGALFIRKKRFFQKESVA